jgi:ABC-2 type transport system permease protein
VIPEGFAEHFGNFAVEDADAVEIIYDSADPIAHHTVAGLMQAAAMIAAPDILMERGLGWLETAGGALTAPQREAVDAFLPFLRGDRPWSELTDEAETATAAGDDAGDAGFTGFVPIVSTAARAGDAADGDGGGEPPSIVAYYAAGIGVMFLLFSMAGAGGTLLEEEEQGTLERLLASRVTMGRLLLANWLFFAVVGVLQVALMFVWGALVFGLELWQPNRLAGFTAMTLVTGAAAAGFGIVLATLCRSRAQLAGLSTIIILIMSALGGSMVPRFVMPAFMNTTAKFTFNGWALDGYLKVFWYDDPQASLLGSLATLWPELLVLACLTVVFMVVARLVARRWEVV